MKKVVIIFIIYFCVLKLSSAQEHPNVEQQIENITEVDEVETEDDSYLQQLQHYVKNKVNINTANDEVLSQFQFLTSLQIAQLLRYRRLMGPLLSLYELQSISAWNEETIQRILPYVFVADPAHSRAGFAARFTGGEHSVLMRAGWNAEKSKGFIMRRNDTTGQAGYPGSRERMLIRYKYQFNQQLQYGFTAEKDPGEQWGKGAQRNGFDFYSAHFFLRDVSKLIKTVAIGDYALNIGQGLMAWQSMAFRKSATILNSKRQAATLRPFNTANEFFFHRGAAITLGEKNWELSFFTSLRNLTANRSVDSMRSFSFITSLSSSGFHRTIAEQYDKNALKLRAIGGVMRYLGTQIQIGVNVLHYQLDQPFIRRDFPYHRFSFSGNRMMNMSIDFSYTWRNLHWYGEVASHNQKALAAVCGLLMSVDERVDLTLVYRNMSRGYQSMYGNAFTESTFPNNEQGFFMGTVVRPNAAIKIEAYADIYRFPWLRFRVDAPSVGHDYLLQLTYQPNKQVQVFTRVRLETKAINYNDNGRYTTESVNSVPRCNWRTQMQINVHSSLTLRQRMELMWYDQGGPRESKGFLAFFDMLFKPILKPYSMNMRLQYFHTDGYDSRIYAYENDVLYSYSIPAFFEHGNRWYLNMQYDLSKQLSCWVRCAQLIYLNRATVGSGLDEIPKNRRTDFRIQLLWRL